MRILVPLHSFEPAGAERAALRLAHQWQARGHDVHLVLGRDEGVRPRLADGLAFDVLQSEGPLTTAAFETLWMIAKLPARIRSARPDVIFCPGNSYAVVGAAVRLALGAACPPIVLKISNDLERADMPMPARAAYRWWCRRQARLLDAFVAIADPMQAEICRVMEIAADRVAVINNPAVSMAEIERLRAARSLAEPGGPGRRFLAAGRLVPQKNFQLLIRAFAQIAKADDRLAILGEGPERHGLEQLARQLGVHERVLLPGHVEDTARWFANADRFVLSSDYEGLPAVVVEAMACGVRVIATLCSTSMSALVEEGFNSLSPVGDEDALASAMAATPSGDAASSMRRAEQFTAERAGDRFVGLFRAVIANCGVGDAVASQQNMVANPHVSR